MAAPWRSSRRAAPDDLSCRTSDELLAFGRSMEAMPQSWRSTMHPTVLPLRTPDGTMAPAYTLRDLAADAAALARELDDRPAHLAGIGVGGMVAQVAALDHPDAFSALTLAGTRPVAPGRPDDDLPDHDTSTMDRLFSRSMPTGPTALQWRSTPPAARRS